jgi:hypothetical protein
VLEDLRIRVSAVGHALGAELGPAHAVPPPAPFEPHHTILGDRDEERALQRIVPDQPPEVGPPERGRPAGVLDGEPRDAEVTAAIEHLEKQATRFAKRPDPARDALASLCHVLLNTNEFMYID